MAFKVVIQFYDKNSKQQTKETFDLTRPIDIQDIDFKENNGRVVEVVKFYDVDETGKKTLIKPIYYLGMFFKRVSEIAYYDKALYANITKGLHDWQIKEDDSYYIVTKDKNVYWEDSLKDFKVIDEKELHNGYYSGETKEEGKTL